MVHASELQYLVFTVHHMQCTTFTAPIQSLTADSIFGGETGSLFLAHSCLALVKISSHICWSFIVLMTRWFLDRVLTYIQRLDSRIWMIQWTNSPLNSSRITKKEQKKTQKLHSLPLFEKRKSMCFFLKKINYMIRALGSIYRLFDIYVLSRQFESRFVQKAKN